MTIRVQHSLVCLLMALCAFGCQSAAEKPAIEHSTLPTREVHAIFPVEFELVHTTCQEVLREQLGYSSVSSTKDDKTGRGRIDADGENLGSVRIETERSRDLASTSVTVLAVEHGSSQASDERARQILKRIESRLWPGQETGP